MQRNTTTPPVSSRTRPLIPRKRTAAFDTPADSCNPYPQNTSKGWSKQERQACEEEIVQSANDVCLEGLRAFWVWQVDWLCRCCITPMGIQYLWIRRIATGILMVSSHPSRGQRPTNRVCLPADILSSP